MKNVLISPSILSADPLHLAEEIHDIESSGADWHHIDVMDGHFVPNLTCGIPLIKALKKVVSKPLDVHIMVSNPDEVVKQYIEAGADILTFHIEAAKDPDTIIHLLKENNVKVGIAINPESDPKVVFPYANKIDLILVMGVHPGFGGQSFIPSTLEKISSLNPILCVILEVSV